MIDPWWNPPWPLQWQQAYHRLRATSAGGVAAADLPRGLCRWARVQQESWEHLHPGQQDLLTALGVTPHAAVGERPAPATRSYPASPGLDHARTYAAQHGHLTPGKHARQDGFPLGRWLGQQRRKQRAATTAAALASLDPWWNPPWPYTWHRTWQQYRATTSGNATLPDTLQPWANAQRSQGSTLPPGQRQLLTTASFTEGWSSPDMKP